MTFEYNMYQRYNIKLKYRHCYICTPLFKCPWFIYHLLDVEYFRSRAIDVRDGKEWLVKTVRANEATPESAQWANENEADYLQKYQTVYDRFLNDTFWVEGVIIQWTEYAEPSGAELEMKVDSRMGKSKESGLSEQEQVDSPNGNNNDHDVNMAQETSQDVGSGNEVEREPSNSNEDEHEPSSERGSTDEHDEAPALPVQSPLPTKSQSEQSQVGSDNDNTAPALENDNKASAKEESVQSQSVAPASNDQSQEQSNNVPVSYTQLDNKLDFSNDQVKIVSPQASASLTHKWRVNGLNHTWTWDNGGYVNFNNRSTSITSVNGTPSAIMTGATVYFRSSKLGKRDAFIVNTIEEGGSNKCGAGVWTVVAGDVDFPMDSEKALSFNFSKMEEPRMFVFSPPDFV